ncbi:group II intron maturase-specific domain-containing protein [Paraburkholderia sp. RL17-337-BIB-A]|uniref:group II intron maturase-specific domain-containing protein n=1 Tax=Paraburkholderia sp. RL17-337-BIB-A TaxID=3031636 RepID=UPI0038BBC9C0
MRQAVRRWRLSRQTSGSLVDLAEQCNPTIRGWWNYYGAFPALSTARYRYFHWPRTLRILQKTSHLVATAGVTVSIPAIGPSTG